MHALTNFVDSLEVPGLTKSALVDMLIEQMGLNGREAALQRRRREARGVWQLRSPPQKGASRPQPKNGRGCADFSSASGQVFGWAEVHATHGQQATRR